MLIWHRKLWLIDHGAALYFHHTDGWETDPTRPHDVFALIKNHLLLHKARSLADVGEEMARVLTPGTLRQIVDLVPGNWLAPDGNPARVTGLRNAYHSYLIERLKAPRTFVDEALRVR